MDLLELEMPNSDDAERSILGAVLVNQEYLRDIEAAGVRAGDFYRLAHQRVFQAMQALVERKVAIDLLTVCEEVKHEGGVEAAGGPGFVSRLMDGIPRLINVRHYAAIVKENANRRAVIQASNEVAVALSTGEATALEAVHMLARSTKHLAGLQLRRVQWARDLDRFLDRLDKREKGTIPFDGVPTGFKGLDAKIVGWVPGFIYIVGARPKVGKTSFLMTCSLMAAASAGVMYNSLEMDLSQLFMRALSSESRVDLLKLGRLAPGSELTEVEWHRIVRAYETLKDLDFVPLASPVATVSELRAAVVGEQMRRKDEGQKPLKIVIVDYVGLMRGAGANRAEQLSRIVWDMKSIASDEKVAVIIAAQIRRESKDNYSKKTGLPPKPRLGDLKDSGGLEEHADVVIFLDRDEVHLQEQDRPVGDKPWKSWLRVAANRHGPVGTSWLRFFKEYTLFVEEDEDRAPF